MVAIGNMEMKYNSSKVGIQKIVLVPYGRDGKPQIIVHFKDLHAVSPLINICASTRDFFIDVGSTNHSMVFALKKDGASVEETALTILDAMRIGGDNPPTPVLSSGEYAMAVRAFGLDMAAGKGEIKGQSRG
jgi:hypothetical protein